MHCGRENEEVTCARELLVTREAYSYRAREAGFLPSWNGAHPFLLIHELTIITVDASDTGCCRVFTIHCMV